MTFGGENIWIGQFQQAGPRTSYRSMTQTLPGVDGARQYRLGRGTRTWTVSGRITSPSPAGLTELILLGQEMVDGKLRTFVDVNGVSFHNCRLLSFEPAGNQVATDQGVTVRVQSAVEQIAY